ncbi:MAG: hypothetical protein M3N08_02865 [Pseudomonadota bacterium]|nr:hypothetical protein [Pseudomonadota bacterium]
MSEYLYVSAPTEDATQAIQEFRQSSPHDRVMHAKSDDEAVKLLAQRGFDGIVSDWSFPARMAPAGLALLNHVRAIAPEMPFAFLSGRASVVMRFEIEASGTTFSTDHIFQKPALLSSVIGFLKRRYEEPGTPSRREPIRLVSKLAR